MVGDAASDENAILVVPSVLSDNLLIRPHCLGSDIDVHVQAELRRKVEGVCTRHGYILANSTSIHSISAARLECASMNGDVIFSVEYNALVCNPPVGLKITLRVSDSNMFAFFAQAGIQASDGQFTPLLDAILVKDQNEGDLLEKLNAWLLADDDEFASVDDLTQPHVCFTRVVDSVLPVASLSKLRINNEHEGDDSETYSVFGDADEVDDQKIKKKNAATSTESARDGGKSNLASTRPSKESETFDAAPINEAETSTESAQDGGKSNGNIGCGKTSLLNEIKSRVTASNLKICVEFEPVEEWTKDFTGVSGRGSKNMLGEFYNDKDRNAMSFQMFVLYTRMKQYRRIA
eukprot:gene7024-121_t